MIVSISEGNSKLGGIPSVSLPPGLSCRRGVLCLKDCYAKNIYNRFPLVKLQWQTNLRMYRQVPGEYFRQIDEYLDFRCPRYFRWHVGGDCPDTQYFRYLCKVVKNHPRTLFLMFTKGEHPFKSNMEIPDNLHVVFSEWPYHPLSEGEHSRSWVRADLRAPKDAFICSGQCDKCKHCFEERNTNIVFKPH